MRILHPTPQQMSMFKFRLTFAFTLLVCMAVNEIIRRRTFSLVIRVSSKASCAKGAPFRMKKNSMDSSATLWMKDPNNENGHHINAVELEAKAVFGRLEEPLIVAPYSEACRGISHVERLYWLRAPCHAR
jgi:hypothetical protein